MQGVLVNVLGSEELRVWRRWTGTRSMLQIGNADVPSETTRMWMKIDLYRGIRVRAVRKQPPR